MVIKLYLRLESTEEPILYNTAEHAEPVRINKPVLLFQETTP
jgi:hypothetical protein